MEIKRILTSASGGIKSVTFASAIKRSALSRNNARSNCLPRAIAKGDCPLVAG